MVDNVAITPGTGATVAADEIGGVLHQRVKVSIGADGSAADLAFGRVAMASALPVVPASDLATNASATFTPAASSHTAGDVVATAQEFTSMGPNAGRIMITSASIEIDSATAQVTTWRLYLYNVTPPGAAADGDAFDLESGDRTAFLGYIDLGTAADLVATQWTEVHGISKQIKLAGTSVFGYLVNGTTLSTENVAHIVTLHAVVL